MLSDHLFIQGIGLVGTLLYFISFQCRGNRNLFRVQFLSYLFYTVHLILLGAITGGISYMINTVRSFCLGSKWKFAHTKAMCAVICLMQIAALFLKTADNEKEHAKLWFKPISPRQSPGIPTMPLR